MDNSNTRSSGSDPEAIVISADSFRPGSSTKSVAESIEIRAGLPSAESVARYFIVLAASESEPDFLTHMRLQKLLYYAQGWSLALRDRPMFPERIEAWAHGPVVRDLYKEYADFGDVPISLDSINATTDLTDDDMQFVRAVWDAYKGYSTTSLRAMSHSELPWIEARGSCAPADRCSEEISHESMSRFFQKAAERGE
ncbi:MAG: DUF4065 domain-containing protein [Planctomycetes bacterium]|nr:DUF4065 domain-containing protein [Planctomycetota bacterium]